MEKRGTLTQFALRAVKKYSTHIIVVIGAIAFLTLVGKFESSTLLSYASKIQVEFILLALFAFCIASGLRCLRFRVLNPSPGHGFEMLMLTATFQIHRVIIPAQAGEFSLPFLLNGRFGVPFNQGVMQVFLLRAIDLMFVLIVFLIGSQFYIGEKSVLSSWISFAAVAGLLIAWLLFQMKKVSTYLMWLSQRLAKRFKKRSFRKLSRAFGGLRRYVHGLSNRVFLKIGLLSLLIGGSAFLNFFSLVHGLGLPISIPEALFGFGLVNLASAIPIKLFSGIGMREVGVATFFGILGLDTEFIIFFVVTFSFASFLFPFVFGGGVWVLCRIKALATGHHFN